MPVLADAHISSLGYLCNNNIEERARHGVIIVP